MDKDSDSKTPVQSDQSTETSPAQSTATEPVQTTPPPTPSHEPKQTSQPTSVVNIQAPTTSETDSTTPGPTSHKKTPAPDLAKKGGVLLNKAGMLIAAIFGAVEVALGLRLVFKLLGANPANAFIGSLYQFTDAFIAPFVGIFSVDLSFGNFVLDIPALIAILIYSLIGYGLYWVTKLI